MQAARVAGRQELRRTEKAHASLGKGTHTLFDSAEQVFSGHGLATCLVEPDSLDEIAGKTCWSNGMVMTLLHKNYVDIVVWWKRRQQWL